MKRPAIQDMAKVVSSWLDDANEEDQKLFLSSTESGLIAYHSNLGLRIRNHFNLWKFSWKPEIQNGIDYSINHPDAISFEVIKTVWREKNEKISRT